MNRKLMWLAVLAGAAMSMPMGVAAESGKGALRVCADPAQLPASTKDLEGYENRIAELFGKSLGLPVEYTWFPQRIGFIRNTLRNNNTDDGDYKCDLVMAAPEGFELAATTIPYFRSTWVLVFAKGRGMDEVKTVDDLARLPEDVKNKIRIGLFDRSPAAEWLMANGLIGSMVPYQAMNGDVADFPERIIQEDLVQGKIDATFVWGPVGGHAAKLVKDVDLVVLPMPPDTGVKYDFQMHMAVRHGENEWKETINGLIRKHQADIDAILEEYGVPTLPLLADGSAADDD
jgi:mxaJ protein